MIWGCFAVAAANAAEKNKGRGTMEAYFDNSATTRCYDAVKEIVIKTMTEDFGNPSAMHKKGMEAERYVKNSAQILARLLKVQEKEILFTSGGTESNNLAFDRRGNGKQKKRKPYYYHCGGACGSGTAGSIS